MYFPGLHFTDGERILIGSFSYNLFHALVLTSLFPIQSNPNSSTHSISSQLGIRERDVKGSPNNNHFKNIPVLFQGSHTYYL